MAGRKQPAYDEILQFPLNCLAQRSDAQTRIDPLAQEELQGLPRHFEIEPVLPQPCHFPTDMEFADFTLHGGRQGREDEFLGDPGQKLGTQLERVIRAASAAPRFEVKAM
jgi:hypothetical protein